VLYILSKSRDLADEKNKFDGIEMIRNNRIVEAKGDKKQQTKEQKFRQYKLP
jgi:hypothetical protein